MSNETKNEADHVTMVINGEKIEMSKEGVAKLAAAVTQPAPIDQKDYDVLLYHAMVGTFRGIRYAREKEAFMDQLPEGLAVDDIMEQINKWHANYGKQ